jgi:hypothetical protein
MRFQRKKRGYLAGPDAEWVLVQPKLKPGQNEDLGDSPCSK